jgi:hypothetical protein
LADADSAGGVGFVCGCDCACLFAASSALGCCALTAPTIANEVRMKNTAVLDRCDILMTFDSDHAGIED